LNVIGPFVSPYLIPYHNELKVSVTSIYLSRICKKG
jgi:hypothetical protein